MGVTHWTPHWGGGLGGGLGATGGVVPGGAAWVTNVVGVGDVLAVPADAPPCIMHVSMHNATQVYYREWRSSKHNLRVFFWVLSSTWHICQHQPNLFTLGAGTLASCLATVSRTLNSMLK